jgi:hypothetical protein
MEVEPPRLSPGLPWTWLAPALAALALGAALLAMWV